MGRKAAELHMREYTSDFPALHCNPLKVKSISCYIEPVHAYIQLHIDRYMLLLVRSPCIHNPRLLEDVVAEKNTVRTL